MPLICCVYLLIQWHALGRDEQAKYYELARRERQLHMQLYPDWSSRANQTRGKKRKRNNKQELSDSGTAPPPTTVFYVLSCKIIRSLSFLFLFVYGYLLHDSILVLRRVLIVAS